MDGTPQAAAIIWLPTEQSGLTDFWDVYDAHYDEVHDGALDALADPDIRPLVRSIPAEQRAANNRRSRELTRNGVLHGDWEGYAADLRTLGRTYAQSGVRFSAWFNAVGAFRQALRPLLSRAYGQTPVRLQAAEHALNKFVDYAMAIIGEDYLAAKEQIILQQQEALRELSTPVLQVRDRMLLLPIVGLIDTFRARQLTEQLLHSIRANRAKVIVMDITGVPAVDSKVANHLVQTVDAARLMGATAIVTGLSADVAQSLVTLGVDLRMLNTVGDLQGGLEEADRLLGYQVVSRAVPGGRASRPSIGEAAAA